MLYQHPYSQQNEFNIHRITIDFSSIGYSFYARIHVASSPVEWKFDFKRIISGSLVITFNQDKMFERAYFSYPPVNYTNVVKITIIEPQLPQGKNPTIHITAFKWKGDYEEITVNDNGLETDYYINTKIKNFNNFSFLGLISGMAILPIKKVIAKRRNTGGVI